MRNQLLVIFLIFVAFFAISCGNSNSSNNNDPEITKNQDAQIDGNRTTDRVAASSYISDVTVANRRIYVAWLDARDGDKNIYFNARAEDRGWIHSSDLRLNPNQIGAELESVKICSGANGRYLHIVWSDAQIGQECVYYSGSSDFGQTFSKPFPLSPGTPFPFVGTLPQIACSRDGTQVFVVWRHGRHDLGFRYSNNAGVSWSSMSDPSKFYVNTDTIGLYLVHFPTIDCSDDGMYCHITWTDYRTLASPPPDGDFFIFHRCWDMTKPVPNWRSSENQVSEKRGSLPFVRCTADGKNVHIIWTDIPSKSTTRYSRGLLHDSSTDFGDTWGTDEIVAETQSDEDDYGMFTCNRDTGDICAVWNVDTTLNGDWTVIARSKIGTEWKPAVQISRVSHRDKKNSHDIPRICNVGNYVYILWTDYRNAPEEAVYYNFSDDFGLTWAGTGFQLNTAGTERSFRVVNPEISCDENGVVYGIWAEARNSNIPQIYGRFMQGVTPLKDEKIPKSNLVSSHAWQGRISVNQNNIYGVWLTDRNGFQDVYFSQSEDNGFRWQNDYLVNVVQGEIARIPQVVSDSNSHVYTIWEYPDYKIVENILETHVYIHTNDRSHSCQKQNKTLSTPKIELLKNPSKAVHLVKNIENNFYSKNKHNYSFNNRATQISSNDYYGGNPLIRTDDQGHVYVLYQLLDLWNENSNYLVVSDDFGESWDGWFVEPTLGSDYLNYDMAISGQYVHIVSENRELENSQVRYARNTDYGIPGNWDGVDVALDYDSTQLSRRPKICAVGEQLFVVWQEYQPGGLAKVHYVYSSDNGENWTNPAALDSGIPGNFTAAEISISCKEDTLYSAWTCYFPNSKDFQIYFGKMQIINGVHTISPSIPISDGLSEARNPSIVCDGNDIYIAWQEKKYGSFDIFGRYSKNGGKTWSALYRWNTNAPGSSNSIEPKLHISSKWVHCIWKDYRYGLNIFYEQRKR